MPGEFFSVVAVCTGYFDALPCTLAGSLAILFRFDLFAGSIAHFVQKPKLLWLNALVTSLGDIVAQLKENLQSLEHCQR